MKKNLSSFSYEKLDERLKGQQNYVLIITTVNRIVVG